MVDAYTFELSRCWDSVVRERQLRALANIHPDLVARVAEGLGLPAPEPSLPPQGISASAAITQLGGTWPVAGRQVGIVVGPNPDVKAVEELRAAFDAAGVVPLVIAPHGGVLEGLTVQRSYAVAASIELDAVVVAGATPPAPDAKTSVDAKAGAPAGVGDPRVEKLLSEVWRHAKAIGVLEGGRDVLVGLRVPGDAVGVVEGSASEVAAGLLTLLAAHRAWERFPAVSAA